MRTLLGLALVLLIQGNPVHAQEADDSVPEQDYVGTVVSASSSSGSLTFYYLDVAGTRHQLRLIGEGANLVQKVGATVKVRGAIKPFDDQNYLHVSEFEEVAPQSAQPPSVPPSPSAAPSASIPPSTAPSPASSRPADADQVRAAIEKLRDQLKSSPQNAPVLLKLGVLHRKVGELETSRTYLEKAVSLAPTSASAHAQLFLTLKGMGKTAEANSARDVVRRLDKDLATRLDAHK